MRKKPDAPRAVAVQLPHEIVRKLDELAARSGVSRHEYMILVLQRATEQRAVLNGSVPFSKGY